MSAPRALHELSTAAYWEALVHFLSRATEAQYQAFLAELRRRR